MKRFVVFVLLLGLCTVARAGAGFEDRRDAAELAFAQKSYGEAYRIYSNAVAQLELDATARRWAQFRMADCRWREQSAAQQADPTKFNEAREALHELLRAVKRVEEQDRVWAEIQESLGDSHWRRQELNWGQAWPFYERALDWWAGQSDLDTARARYLAIVRKATRPEVHHPWQRFGHFGNQLPFGILENALTIAKGPEDKAWMNFLIALAAQQQGGGPNPNRITDAFEAALAPGKASDWYDDALLHYAQWMERQGRVETNEEGALLRKPDYVRAAELYRRLLKEFAQGESRHRDQAKNQLENIVNPALSVGVEHFFLPGSELSFFTTWRNVKRIEFTLYALDLVKDVELAGKADKPWLESINPATLKKVHALNKDTQDDGTHEPGRATMPVGKPLEPGAYLLLAAAGGQTARELVLVTDAALAIKTGGPKALAWFCDALTGEPIPEADVRIWQRYHDRGRDHWRVVPARSDQDGIAQVDLPDGHYETLVFASNGKRQALATGHAWWNRHRRETQWKIYAFTDRTAYRPGETVQWKIMARTYDGSHYATPAEATLTAIVNDPRGAQVLETNLTLNAFGAAWSELPVTDTMPLGEYQVTFHDGSRHVGNATLFRMEEFKLPEFKVAVRTPEVDGRKATYLQGDTVSAEIQADYYSGGPVANASVEVVIRQRPYFRTWQPPRPYGWFYRDMQPQQQRWWGGEGQVVKRETIRTDAEGRARISFDTQRSGQELEYTIEARVTDASRREIVGTGSVRVGNQRYFVHLEPENRLRRPGQKAQVELRARDANDQAIGVTGKVKVARLVWTEKWISPLGETITGPSLRAARAEAAIWPPLPPPNRPPWRCVERRYEEKEISLQTVVIPTNGTTDFVFTTAEVGYYVVRWHSPQAGGAPVSAECPIWATTEKDADIGYIRAGGVELIVDKDTFREGETAAVMLATPASGRWVLFGVEGDDLYEHRVVKLDGAVKLIQLPVTEKHVPNIFLTAASFSDAQFSADQKQIVVPPVKHFLSVTVTTDRAAYQPREDAKLQVAVTDHAGMPVEAEVALAVADEAVLYIQQELAGDPREFYFGSKRNHQVQTWTSFNMKQLRRAELLVEQKDDASIRGLDDWGFGDRLEESELSMNGLFAGRSAGGRRARMSAMPQPSAAPADAFGGGFGAVAAMSGSEADTSFPQSGAKSGADQPNVIVRADFRATALWKPDFVTDRKGSATATVALPDSLTSWQGKARVLTKDNQFGIAEVSFPARLPLICRLQAPRFFVVGDTCTVSAVIQNNTDEAVEVRVELAAEGLEIRGQKTEIRNPLTLPARGEVRVDWQVAATMAGEAKLTATAKGGRFGDAMEKTYTVYEHGIDKFLGASTKLRGDSATLRLDLPPRKPESTEVVVQVAPSIAVTMLDALPYLANYPYGCTEQTMSRFLPSVVVAKTLKDLGLKPEAVADKLFGGIEAANRATRTNTLAELDRMVDAGLARLYDFQHADGGWGWWKEGDSDAYMTAYVLWGFALAMEAGIDIRGDAIERGLSWLEKKLVDAEELPDQQAWLLHALSAHRRTSAFASKASNNLWERRATLNAYTRALFLLATVNYGDQGQRAAILAQNLRDGVFIDDKPDTSVLLEGAGQGALATARWGLARGWWRWSEGPIESTAFALKALLAANPADDLIEPAMNWLVKNRRGAQWSNTRDTAFVLLALSDYLRHSKETAAELGYDVVVNGTKIASAQVTPETALGAPSRYVVDRALLRDGTNDIRVVRTSGSGPLYISAFATFFSLEEPIAPAGHELFVKRQYFKIVPRPTLLKGVVYEKLPLNDGDRVRSGERIEVVVAVESKNDYEYLVFEDLKPAGFEAVEVRSGGNLHARQLTEPAGRRRFAAGLHDVDASDYTGHSRWIYPEWRDRRVALFADKLPQGLWELRYELRAETPGHFHALPLVAHAMYVPELRANSAEVRVQVEE
ncbi:MAG TPA: MG2 domain-containing protein [Kiritimatiellia bacterium]|nr:MG2 domain-containing protein [Kiritimatiellia bacterium]